MDTLKNRNTVYSASSTSATGALFYREITALLPLLKQENFNNLLSLEVKENRYLRINAQSTRRRVINEIKSRLEYKFEGFLERFEDSSPNEQVLMLFFLTLKAVPLLYDFHFDVTLPAWKGSARVFEPFSYQMKLDEIGNGNETVRDWAESTSKQILKVYKRMLKEAGFLQGIKLIKPVCSSSFFNVFIQNNEIWFLEACFLSQTEREKIINDYKFRKK